MRGRLLIPALALGLVALLGAGGMAAADTVTSLSHSDGVKSITTEDTVVGQKLTGKVTIDYPKPVGKDILTTQNPNITVTGQCPAGSIVTIYDNNSIAGSGPCGSNGRYAIPIRLFIGKNELQARAVNELNVGDLESNKVVIYYYQPTGTGATCGVGEFYLLPVEGVINATPGADSMRHVVIVGGTIPYQLSWDWGDGSVSTSTSMAQGETELNHTYTKTGVYTVKVKATDYNGAVASVQVVTVVLNLATLDVPGRLLTYWPLALLVLMVLATYLWGHRRGRIYERRLEADERRLAEADEHHRQLQHPNAHLAQENPAAPRVIHPDEHFRP